MSIPAKNRWRSGFTLLELMFVIVIAAILVGAVTISFTGAIRSNQLRTTTARIASLAVYARSRALTTGRPIVMQMDSGRGKILLLEQQGEGELVPVGENASVPLPREIVISSFEVDEEDANQGEIMFYPTGGAQAAHIAVTTNAGRSDSPSRDIWINKMTGRVKVE